MPSISKAKAEQFNKREKNIKNDFKIDRIGYVIHGRSQLVRRIRISELEEIEATIQFQERVENMRNTGINDIVITTRTFNRNHEKDHVWVSHGFGRTTVLRMQVGRKLVRYLDEMSAKINYTYIVDHEKNATPL